LTSRKSSWELLLLSFISLFLELLVIRWLSVDVRIFAYFKNLPLMAAFLGFGVGFFLHNKSDIVFPWFPRLACLLVVIIAEASSLGITHVIFVDPRQYLLFGSGFGDHALNSVPSYLQSLKAITVIAFLFFLTMATFASLTSRLGEMLNRERPLAGYSINVAGSLLGVAGFSLVSYLQWPPVIWLILTFLPLLYFFRARMAISAVYFLLAILVTLMAANADPAIWSPYYRISVGNASSQQEPFDAVLCVNYDGFQSIQNLSKRYIGRFSENVQRRYDRHYNIPYALSRRKTESVLILGGGTGNDAAAALRNGAARVDVVEIDPAIAHIGLELHPEKPYTSKKVHLYIDDARSFLQRTKRKYDLVVFATLDSHTVFSSLSSLRLDDFVFTRESVSEVKNILTPGGGIVINFFATKPWLFWRHFNTLKEVMGKTPLIYGTSGSQEDLLLVGDIFDSHRNPGITDYVPVKPPSTASASVEPTSDDWPFLFLQKRGIPFHYLLPLSIIFVLALFPLHIAQVTFYNIDWHLFFMGSAFLLIETKAVTTLALIFGSTWSVNSVVIAAVLIMILLANLLAGYFASVRFSLLYAALVASLLFNFLFHFDYLNRFDWTIRLLASGFVIAVPLFLASLIFAKAFSVVVSPSLSLASNLLGALVGGLLEYLDMLTGLRWLNVVALILYCLSFIFLYVRAKSGESRSGTFFI
jgi:spermidine synthase